MKLKTQLSAFALMLLPSMLCSASNLPKAYNTGEQIEKPMIMRKFVEFTNARTPPELIFEDRNGNPKSMNDYRGNLTMINIWASWCGPCLKELPSLEKMQEHFKDEPLKIVPVSVDEDSPEKVYELLAKYNLDHTYSLFDKEQSMNGVMPTNVVPATYFLDAKGNIIGFARGYLDWSDPDVNPYMDKLIDKYTETE
ncbi:TlpA family protein disulfide reductase [Ferrimonas aestuarii]|nr:TlpA disulfide reductase family protein [Ferrimonas aestuarii]